MQLAQVNRFGSYSMQETFFYLQKISLAALVLLWLRALAGTQPRWLTYFADEAFSIYFLHVFFISLLADISWVALHDPSLQPWIVYASSLAFFGFSLAMSVLVVWLMRLLLGKSSRLLIGS